jgi:N-acetylmuramoyl-L-alanine amidase
MSLLLSLFTLFNLVHAAPKLRTTSPFVVVLDPGHGGEDTGALHRFKSKSIFEKDITLALAKQTFQELRRMGIAAILTRYEDASLSLDERTEIANKAKAALFVSIHVNSSQDTHSSGAETYIFKATTNEASRRLADLENGKSHRVAKVGGPNIVELIMDDLATTANYGASIRLAQQIQKYATQSAKTRNRGTKEALFYVLMKTQMPGVLFEPGFLNNPAELKKLRDPAYQKAIARGLALGIVNWKFQSQDNSIISERTIRTRSIANRNSVHALTAERN